MDELKLERINELARKSRETGLTQDELMEQKKLRDEYIAAFRSNLKKQLDNIEIANVCAASCFSRFLR